MDAQACEHRVICFRMVSSSRVWWHHRPVIPATGEWLPVMLAVTKATEGKKRSCFVFETGTHCRPGLQSEFQHSQGYTDTEKPCLKKKSNQTNQRCVTLHRARRKSLLWLKVPKGEEAVMVRKARLAGRNRKLACHIVIHTQEAEKGRKVK